MTETSKARDLSWDCTAALQGGENSGISISISISKQSSNQHHHRTLVAGLVLIFLGPQPQILRHRHHGHVAGPLSICPAYWSRCRCGKHTPSPVAFASPPHGTETPKAVGNAAKDRDGSRRLGSTEARV